MESIKRRSQLPTEFSVEELLKTLESDTKESTEELKSDVNDVPSFLMAYGIKPGKHKVTNRLFYELYKLWAKEPLDRSKFTHELGKYLVLEVKYYCVDQSSFKINEKIQEYVLKHTRNKTKSKSYKKHFDYFLQKYSIKPGTYYIESFILYYLYDKWVYGIKKTNPLGYYPFLNFCKLYFNTKRNSENRITWFGVDGNALFKVITQEQINNIRKGRKMRYVKNIKKKQEEIPRNRSNS